MFHFYTMSRIGKLIETENILMVTREKEIAGNQNVLLLFGVRECSELNSVDGSTTLEYTKNH